MSINEVMSLSSIMFRMKSNALLLTIITTVSALAIGLLSLSYISYYSAEQTAKDYVAADFAFIYSDDAKRFTDALEKEGIEYKEKRIEVIQTNANLSSIIDTNFEEKMFNPNHLTLPVVSERAVKHINVSRDEVVLSGYNDLMQRFMPLKDSGPIELEGQKEVIPLKYTELKKDHIVSIYFTFSSPVAIVDETIFTQLKNDLNPDIQRESSLYIGIVLKDETKLGKANDKFQQMEFKGDSGSRLEISNHEKRVLGLAMFIVGFLGLTFLITSGCILYFKQMGESEEEKPNYTILRKLGFTQGDLIKGIQGKQLFSFGIPLVVGLSHSYFAVQSGWFLFGTEIWTPMLIVMLLYAALYSIFGILSVFYYKKIIKEAL